MKYLLFCFHESFIASNLHGSSQVGRAHLSFFREMRTGVGYEMLLFQTFDHFHQRLDSLLLPPSFSLSDLQFLFAVLDSLCCLVKFPFQVSWADKRVQMVCSYLGLFHEMLWLTLPRTCITCCRCLLGCLRKKMKFEIKEKQEKASLRMEYIKCYPVSYWILCKKWRTNVFMLTLPNFTAFKWCIKNTHDYSIFIWLRKCAVVTLHSCEDRLCSC